MSRNAVGGGRVSSFPGGNVTKVGGGPISRKYVLCNT